MSGGWDKRRSGRGRGGGGGGCGGNYFTLNGKELLQKCPRFAQEKDITKTRTSATKSLCVRFNEIRILKIITIYNKRRVKGT